MNNNNVITVENWYVGMTDKEIMESLNLQSEKAVNLMVNKQKDESISICNKMEKKIKLLLEWISQNNDVRNITRYEYCREYMLNLHILKHDTNEKMLSAYRQWEMNE